MKTIKTLISLGAAGLLASCAYGGGYHHDYAADGVDYDGYYDDFYGSVGDGYWGPDDYFYYSDAPGHPFRRDDAHHFRHDAASGFHPVHGHHAGAIGPAGGGAKPSGRE